MHFPDTLTDDEMKFRVKEWIVAGYQIVAVVDPMVDLYIEDQFDLQKIPTYNFLCVSERQSLPAWGGEILALYDRQDDGGDWARRPLTTHRST